MQFCHFAVVALKNSDKVARHIVLVVFAEGTHDGAIDGNVRGLLRVAGIDKNIAGMHVGMKEIVLEHLGEKYFYTALGQRFEIDTSSFQLIDIGHRYAVNALHHQHFLVGVVPVDLWHVEQGRPLEVMPQ